jgi:hypothetical protein
LGWGCNVRYFEKHINSHCGQEARLLILEWYLQ